MKRMATTLAALAMLGVFLLGRGDVAADTSGPHASGYRWTDTNSPGPQTTFSYVDISASGTDLGFSDDDSSVVTLPFAFEYFGVTYTEVEISSNGFLSFNTADPGDCNDNYNWDDTAAPDGPNGSEAGNPIPHTDVDCDDDSGWGANPLIAVWFTDQDPGECGAVYYQTQGSTFIVQWLTCNNDDPTEDLDCAVDFEVILYQGSGDIKMQYKDTTYSCNDETHDEDSGKLATVGLDKDAMTGLQYEWNEPVLTNGLAVLFSTSAPVVPVPTEESCIPGLPPGYTCNGQPQGGGGSGGAQTPVTTSTVTDETPVPVATATAAPATTAPTQPSGGQQGAITAPNTGGGSSGGTTALFPAIVLTLFGLGALTLGGGLVLTRRS